MNWKKIAGDLWCELSENERGDIMRQCQKRYSFNVAWWAKLGAVVFIVWLAWGDK